MPKAAGAAGPNCRSCLRPAAELANTPDLEALMVNWARYAYTAVADQMAAAADAPSP